MDSIKYIVDACVWLGYLNKVDPHHQKCKEFFDDVDKRNKNGESVTIVIPAHSMVEVHLNIRRRCRESNWKGIPSFLAKGPRIYHIDDKFINHIQKLDLYNKFDKLRPADAIYAMIAYIEKIPLVTLDEKDFNKVKDLIEIKFL